MRTRDQTIRTDALSKNHGMSSSTTEAESIVQYIYEEGQGKPPTITLRVETAQERPPKRLWPCNVDVRETTDVSGPSTQAGTR